MTLTSLLFCCLLSVFSPSYDASSWMTMLEDTLPVSALSIPGAHDAATGEGMRSFLLLGTTQTLGLRGQWESGVRAFDLRPAVCDTTLHVYHGSLRTKVSFAQALDTICAMLDTYPGEMAVVLLREEGDSQDDAEHALWPKLVGNAIARLGNRAALFTPDMTLGEARGKILFISRNAYEGTDKGAFVSGWNHSADGTCSARIRSCRYNTVVPLQMQDYYAPTNKDKRDAKLKAVKRYLALAEEAPAGVWTINFLSGYSSTLLGIKGIATTAGYKRNAAWLHPLVQEAISSVQGGGKRALGILLMDFAGEDRVGGSLSDWHTHDVCGASLVHEIVKSNFELEYR